MSTKYTYPVKLDPKAVAKAKIAASYMGEHLAEYISKVILRVALKEIDEGHAALKAEPKQDDGQQKPKKTRK